MAERKGSKNSIENRGAKTVIVCDKCGGEMAPMRMMGAGKNRMVYECKCGVFDKTGVKV
ncbi:MAG: hypothetical protein GF398_00590 [Chitinivibrionales bacterium]|nr:hypothetical protein [Chitinivibrionales bacterium]